MDRSTFINAESASEIRNLRTGSPVWKFYESKSPPVGHLRASQKADVVIVGAGITGALIAEATTAAGLDTMIIDRRPPVRGSTFASTALLQFEIDTPLIHLAEQIGFEKAARAWRRSYAAVQGLSELVVRLGIPCDFRTRKALYLAGTTLPERQLAEEGRQRRAIGLPSTYLDHVALRQLSGIERAAALWSRGAADVDPVRLTNGLLAIAVGRGAQLCSPVQLAEFAPVGRSVGMATSDGIEIEAKALVFATGYELVDGVPSNGHKRTSTWAFATRPQPQNLRGDGDLIWEASEPYLYIRTTTDGRLVVGGEDEAYDDEATRDSLLDPKIQALRKKTASLLPWLETEPAYAWTGTFGESENGLPTIGPVPGMANCYAVLGYGGNGITFGFLAAEIISRLLVGRPDTDAEIFAFPSIKG